MAEHLDLSKVRLDGGTQPRASIFEDTLAAYVESMGRGDPFPPIVVFFDGTDHWLADGFHRFHAAKALGRFGLPSEIRQGTQRDAILYSVGANHDHGRPRTSEDKRRAVMRLLDDPEWREWPLRQIAVYCRVAVSYVHRLQGEAVSVLGEQIAKPAERTVERAGATYTMNTAAIGRRSEPNPRHDEAPPVTVIESAPVGSPPRPAPVEAFRADMAENGPIFDAIEAIKAQFRLLPLPEDAAERFPNSLRHTFSPAQARHIAVWLNAFADAWEAHHGDADVAA